MLTMIETPSRLGTYLPFLLLIGALMVFSVYRLLRSKEAEQWRADNNAPQKTVNATVVSKRRILENFRKRSHLSLEPRSDPHYYATFRLDNGDEIELSLILHQGHYRTLEPGDRGSLTYQGKRYIGFEKV